MGFFNHYFLKDCERVFPKPDISWWKYENPLERKWARNDVHNFPGELRALISELQSKRFVTILEGITGIDGLIVDHGLNGGGLHQITQGGKLDIHADYNYHPITKLDRRVNVLVYLNSDWASSWKGSLELWDKGMTHCIDTYSPIINRMVIFNVTDDAFHGHPDPLACPSDVTRKSIALYYYTNGRPEHEKTEPHSTIFKARPWDVVTPEIEALRQQRAIKRV